MAPLTDTTLNTLRDAAIAYDLAIVNGDPFLALSHFTRLLALLLPPSPPFPPGTVITNTFITPTREQSHEHDPQASV